MNKTVLISDFSKTLTSSDNPTTWSVFAKSGLLGKEYTDKRDKYFEEYREFEKEWNIDKTKEWWWKHLWLFIEFELTKTLIEKIVWNEKYFKPREWLNIFFDYILNSNIEIIIITSSWISNFVNEFLRQEWITSNKIKVIWNTLEFNEEWKAIWYKDDIVTSLNKWEYSGEYWENTNIVLLWDWKNDLNMVSEWNIFKIWFCNKEKSDWYDVYLWKDWNLEDVIKYI